MASAAGLLFTAWNLSSLDPEVAIHLRAQYPLTDGLETKADPTIGRSSSAGSSSPSVQWSAGGAESVKLTATFQALHFLDDLRPKIALLERTRKYDPSLGRAPRMLFSWGERVLAGFVTSLDLRILDRFVTGLPRSVTFQLEITEAPVVVVETVSPVSGETLYVRLVDGQTFEQLGAAYLGNPLRGELIRRLNPEVLGVDGAREEGGDRVKVLEADHPEMRATVKPTAPPFLDDDWKTIVQDLGVTRGTGTTRGLPWALLPEVLSGEVG
jgi:hypothetical protein